MTTTTYYARRFNEYMSELWRRRDFVWFLARGNIKARNASTFLGLVWWVLNPLMLGLVYFFIFGLIFPTRARHLVLAFRDLRLPLQQPVVGGRCQIDPGKCQAVGQHQISAS